MSAPQRRQRPPAQPNILSNAPPSSPPLPLVPAAPCWPSRTPPTPPRRRGGRGGRRAAPRTARLRKAANLQLALARLGCFGVCQSCDHFTALPHADGLRDRALGTLSSRSHEQGVRSSKVCSAAALRCAQQLLSGVLSSCSQLCSAAALTSKVCCDTASGAVRHGAASLQLRAATPLLRFRDARLSILEMRA